MSKTSKKTKAETTTPKKPPAEKKTPHQKALALLTRVEADFTAVAKWAKLTGLIQSDDIAGFPKMTETEVVKELIDSLRDGIATISKPTAGWPAFGRGSRSKMAVGDRVRVKLDKVALYTKHGLYRPAELMNLSVSALAGREARVLLPVTKDEPNFREIHIRSLSHLEPHPA